MTIINIILFACMSNLGHVRDKQVHLLGAHMYVGDGLVNDVILLSKNLPWLKLDPKQKKMNIV